MREGQAHRFLEFNYIIFGIPDHWCHGKCGAVTTLMISPVL